jgi:1-acyl-sn-glycerol-3-phosphate acyltransferase
MCSLCQVQRRCLSLSSVLYWFLKFLALGPLLKVVFRPWAEGLENIPHDGPAIVAANHLSYSDWLFMPLVSPRRLTFVAKAEYFEAPGFTGWLKKTFFSGTGQVPIDRTSGAAASGALKTQLRLLSEGHVCGIFPEGTRSHDGRLYKGRTGVARLALLSGVPVIPVGVINTNVIAPPGKKLGRITRPGVRFGKPLDFSRYAGMQDDRYILRAVTDEIMYEIMELTGEEYVDLYAKDAKALTAASADETAHKAT